MSGRLSAARRSAWPQFPDLIRLRLAAGRPLDLADVERLRVLESRSEQTRRMLGFDPASEPHAWGAFEDAERLRRWSFLRRTPEQRLASLTATLELACQSGALKPRRPESADSTSTE